MSSYGINVVASLMYPCSEELSQTVCVCHPVGTVVYGLKYKQSEKSQKPWSEDIAQCLSSVTHDAAVCIGKNVKVKK